MAIIGFPCRDGPGSGILLPNQQSELFDNLYKPIWDNGENGTPVNDDDPLRTICLEDRKYL